MERSGVWVYLSFQARGDLMPPVKELLNRTSVVLLARIDMEVCRQDSEDNDNDTFDVRGKDRKKYVAINDYDSCD